MLRFVHDHNDRVMGTLIALFLITGLLLLIRSLSEKEDPASSSANAGADLKAIEGAMRKVLSSQPVSVMAGDGGRAAAAGTSASDANDSSGTVSAAAANEIAILTQVVSERDEQLALLSKEVEALKVVAASALKEEERSNPGSVEGFAGDEGAIANLQAQVADLQARLAEYEIIEEDIADLSLFKEENARLREEIGALRQEMAPASEGAVAPSSFPETPATANVKTEDPLAGELDVDKILIEVESMPEAVPETEGDVLLENLDTDKLLSEMDQLKAGGLVAAPQEEVSASDDTQGTMSFAESVKDEARETAVNADNDDLFAEFRD